MNCEKALVLIDLVLDGEATESEEHMLHFHVAGCASCRRALEMGRDISSVFRQISRPEPPGDLEARVRARLAQTPPASVSASRIFRWSRLAVALPFVAALLLIIGLGPGGGEPGQTALQAAEASGKATYTELSMKRSISTPPMAAYARPASLVTF